MINDDSETKKGRGRPRKGLEDKLSDVLTTDRQKAFLRNRLAGMNKRQAAIQAGYAVSTASIMAKRLTDRLTCSQAFIEEMHKQGLTIEAIVEEIKRGMTEAMHPQHPDQPDNFNRRAYADMAIRLYGGYAPTKVDVQKNSQERSFRLSMETVRIAEELTGEKILVEDAIVVDPDDDETPL
jgi:hypothetical protein